MTPLGSGLVYEEINDIILEENAIQENSDEVSSSEREGEGAESQIKLLIDQQRRNLIEKLPFSRLRSEAKALKSQDLSNNILSRSYLYLPHGLS